MTDLGSILTSGPGRRPATRGLKLSHPRYTLPDTVITSGSAVDRAV